MALTDSDKRDIEVLTRKEIKDFLDSSTLRQFDERMLDMVRKELNRGKLENEVKDIVVKMLREFYGFMYTQRSYWESRIKNA